MPAAPARIRFLDLLRESIGSGTLVKLTLGKHRGADTTLRNLFVRPIVLKAGPHLSLVWRHDTRDVTRNFPPAAALELLAPLIGGDFLDAHLFTSGQVAQLETQPDGTGRLKITAVSATPRAPIATHDRAKAHLISADTPWLRELGVINDRGAPREGMADKFRQIQKFAELLTHLLDEAFPDRGAASARPLRILDAGCGKGYLTFALAHLLGPAAEICGIERRPALVDFCNRAAATHGFAAHLRFEAGEIGRGSLPGGENLDVLIALHACDTATDDALARGVAAGARLLVVAPCCQKELRPQLTAPAVLADALRHGIFQERQAEFVTDALRAQLLEWAGYRTKVFEFISTEHTAKNLMIAAVRAHPPGDATRAERLRDFAAFYGIRHQALARLLGLPLSRELA
ncbi:MAG: SAM-dependent methyltransferase [Verrucomicrobia bacterium]|nr:SAM-dependent methyltransferase [Verrucomicrobiota bacterium]